MLILILITVQYLQNACFSFEKDSRSKITPCLIPTLDLLRGGYCLYYNGTDNSMRRHSLRCTLCDYFDYYITIVFACFFYIC